MKASRYLMALLLPALIINENLVQWALAVVVGGHGLASGFQDAFKSFTITGYLLLTAFRLVPYVGLGILLLGVLKTKKFRDYAPSILIGGLVGIVAMVLLGSWLSLRPLYTDEQVSLAIVIAFVWIPIYAMLTGAIGAFLAAMLYRPFRPALRRGKVGR